MVGETKQQLEASIAPAEVEAVAKVDQYNGFNSFLRKLRSIHEKIHGHVATGCRNFDGLRKCHACSTELLSYILL